MGRIFVVSPPIRDILAAPNPGYCQEACSDRWECVGAPNDGVLQILSGVDWGAKALRLFKLSGTYFLRSALY